MPMTLADATFALLPFAQILNEEEKSESYSLSWALIMLCIVLGMLATFRPIKRASKLKKGASED
ncbi:hypothetical protein Pla175_01120 [Pirellulimonas nuda]|uniref:Uncharacterized protein n=1 Tax=Pirellulimonas nuda TaxID=2528009 RepID=A0A518D5K7_9BACT|nr:hypothetical protein [Pirellulimonas nuda]QDU86762.1 hypothetical protein Pla175_01120 [Pirellulimonas nuda]